MSKEERFEIFNEDGEWVIKDNEQLPHLLDLYKSCVRLNEFVNKVADLEAKLAEMTEKYNACQEARKLEIEFNKQDKKELKQQLAEKEKENQQIKDKLHTAEQETLHFQNKYFAEKQIAIEELEKVKEKVICGVIDIGNPFWSYFRKDGSQYMTSEDLHNALEQEFTYQIQEQIKELKEKK